MPLNSSLALATNALAYRYRGKSRQPEQLLTFPDIAMDAAGSCAIVGPSGCGKTTLMHLIAGLLSPASGSVVVAGQSLSALNQRQRDRFRGKHIGMVLQQLRLVRSLTAVENVLLAQRWGSGGSDRTAATELLCSLGLEHRLAQRPAELSQGEAQRVAIARALVSRPAVMLADEPTSSLDDDNAERVLELLTNHCRAHGTALLVVTHDSRLRGRLDQQIELSRPAMESGNVNQPAGGL